MSFLPSFYYASLLTFVAVLRTLSVCCVCVFSFALAYRSVAVLHRMCAVVSFVIPILENLALRCSLPALCYLCEITEDGSVLAGVELELPFDGVGAPPSRKFFWSVAWSGCLDAYDQAAVQAIRFLQGVYGFVIRDYNYDCMLEYRDCMRSAIAVAVSAGRYAGRLEREASRQLLPAAVGAVDWQLLCSRLVASLRYV
jgi:hypothetical protein